MAIANPINLRLQPGRWFEMLTPLTGAVYPVMFELTDVIGVACSV
ncbi:MAG: hypothetical protein O3C28_08870 [Proteobacteria bacterium]|nr:hypothetical protein [Pseudomonadota bacterium]